jgi:hypothetical protein
MKWKGRVPYNLFSVTLVGALLLSVGCGFLENAGTISGTVRYKGQPLPEGSVSFVSDNGRVLTGAIDKAGRYLVAHVPVGAAKVTVQVASSMPSMSFVGVPKTSQTTGTTVQIPIRYSVTATSGLRHDVTKGKQTFDIDLTE